MRRVLLAALLLVAACGQDGARVPDPGTPGRAVTAFDRATGDVLWRKEVAPPTAAYDPLLVGGVAVVGSDGPLVAYDARSGERLWSVEGSPFPRAAGELLLLERDGVLQGVEPRSGRERWRVATAGRSVHAGDGGVVLARDVARAAQVSSLSLRDGSTRWTVSVPVEVTHAYAGTDLVALAGLRRDVLALDAADGSVRWRAAAGPLRQAAVAAGRVLAASETGVTAYDAVTGRQVWAQRTGAGASPLQAAGGRVLAASVLEQALVLRLDDGTELARRDGHQDAALTEDGLVLSGPDEVVARDPAGAVAWRAQARTGVRPYAFLDADEDVVVLVQSWAQPEPRD